MRSRCKELPNVANMLLRLLSCIFPVGSPPASTPATPVHTVEDQGLACAASLSSASRHAPLSPFAARGLASVSLQCETCLDRHRWQKLSTNLLARISERIKFKKLATDAAIHLHLPPLLTLPRSFPATHPSNFDAK
jgi:hypothetical protein